MRNIAKSISIAGLLLNVFISSHIALAQELTFNPLELKQIKNYKSIQLENGLTIIQLNNEDTSDFFIRTYTNLPEYMAKNFRAILEIENEIRKISQFKLPAGWTDQRLKNLRIELKKDQNGYFAHVGQNSLDSAFYLFSDLFQRSVLDLGQFNYSKAKILSKSDSLGKLAPDKIDKITKSIIYGKDHPILRNFDASEINAVNPANYTDFRDRFYRPNNSYLLVIGNISLDSLRFLASKVFTSWKKKELPTADYKLIPIDEPKIVFFDTIPSGQTDIKILFPFALHPFTFDSEKAELLSILFQDILNQKLVLDQNLAKKIDARFESDKITGNYQLQVQLTKDSLKQVIEKIIETISELKAGNFPEEKLNKAKNRITTNFKKNATDLSSISWLIINTERNNLPKDYYADFIDEVEKTDKSGIQTFSAKYLNYNTALFQIPGKWYKSLNDFIGLSKDFRIELYDLDGNLNKFIPKGFNGFSVIDKYITAIGGETNIKKIKEVSIRYGAIYELLNGEQMYVEGQIVHKAGDHYFSENRMIRPKQDTLFLSREVYNGTLGIDSSMLGKKKLFGDDLELLKYRAPMVPELNYKDWLFTAKIIKADTLYGNYVWLVELKNPAKQHIIDYYDVDLGLRYKREVKDKHYLNERTIIYSQYQKFNEDEILYPYLKIIFAHETTIRQRIRELDYQSKSDKKLFEIF